MVLCRGELSGIQNILKRECRRGPLSDAFLLLPNWLHWEDFKLWALLLLRRVCQRCGDGGDGAKQDESVVLRGRETSAFPELSRFVIDGVDHQGTPTDQSGGLDATLKGMFYQTCADTSPHPFRVRGKLTEEKTRNRIGWLPGADRARQDRRNDGGRRQAVIPDDAPRLVDDENRRETFLLIGKRARLQPIIECRLAAGKFGNIMRRRKRFWGR